MIHLPPASGAGYSRRVASGDDAGGAGRGVPPEPFVFECRACGKVFEAHTTRACCPECDSLDVECLTP
jgi:Zn finger protein HypA/HybF involved in hydrogenase expression